MNAVTAHIVSSPEANAAVIEATVAFDVLSLHRGLCAQLASSGRNVIDAEAMLDRVKIIRAFDFFGIVEALDEIKDASNSAPKPPMATHVSDSDEEGGAMLLDWPASPGQKATTPEDPPKGRWLLVFLGFGQIVNALFKRDFVQG